MKPLIFPRAAFVMSRIVLSFGIIAASFFGTLWLLNNIWDVKYELVEVFPAKDLPSLTGRLNERGARVATEGVDRQNFVTYGPYIALKKGAYQIHIYYSSSAAPTQSIGTWDIMNGTSAVANGSLKGTNGKIEIMSVYFNASDTPTKYEFRNNWTGSKDIEIYKIELLVQRP
jgi:hypothetical protein